MTIYPQSEPAAKPKLIFCFVVSPKSYKPLKKALLGRVNKLITLLSPEPGQRAVSLGQVIWRALRPEWRLARYAHQSLIMEVTQGNGFSTTECGFYAYLANERLIEQGFRDMAASDERIMFCIAAPDTECLEQAVNPHLDANSAMVVNLATTTSTFPGMP
ncbi:hypothetical protein [Ferribacterium limneticum]|uniref:hypothetical protein n=1 Tax=Ferribacterium limneticum TaxID=76259 RepID=UPI001CF83FEA|nr:hypothetical protein [Ferribacterium limneticum]UCV22545.1 hypothetical protein KI613_18860 [Ferribacterium limneticum]